MFVFWYLACFTQCNASEFNRVVTNGGISLFLKAGQYSWPVHPLLTFSSAHGQTVLSMDVHLFHSLVRSTPDPLVWILSTVGRIAARVWLLSQFSVLFSGMAHLTDITGTVRQIPVSPTVLARAILTAAVKVEIIMT